MQNVAAGNGEDRVQLRARYFAQRSALIGHASVEPNFEQLFGSCNIILSLKLVAATHLQRNSCHRRCRSSWLILVKLCCRLQGSMRKVVQSNDSRKLVQFKMYVDTRSRR